MSAGSLVPVFTSIVDTVSLPKLGTHAALPSGVTTNPQGTTPTGMSGGPWARVSPQSADPEPLPALATKAVLPSGVTATKLGPAPTGMSARFTTPLSSTG